MIDFLTIEPSEINTGQHLLQKELLARDWRAEVPYVGCPHIFIYRGKNETVPIHVFSTTPPTTTYAAAHIADNKYATHQVLAQTSVRQLPTMLADESSIEDSEIDTFLNEMGRVVVKPVDGGHGKGITVGVDNINSLHEAIRNALNFTKSLKKVVIQKQYDHAQILDIRIACIDYKFVAATHRTPAAVTGDGASTARQLIEAENTSGRRGEPYRAPLAFINIDAAQKYLGSKIDEVIASGVQLQVLGVANYGAGGEIIDITDDIPQWMIESAIEAARALSLPVCGVDFMLAAPPVKNATEQQLDPVIVEVNKCPSLAIHDMPTKGQSRGAVGKYVEYLATL